jgi:hypothetical protein
MTSPRAAPSRQDVAARLGAVPRYISPHDSAPRLSGGAPTERPDSSTMAPTDLRPFLERHPLYTKMQADLPESYTELFPETVTAYCAHCRGERTFRRPEGKPSYAERSRGFALESTVYTFDGVCTDCNEEHFRYFVEVNADEAWVRKVGQAPPPNVAGERDVVKLLGDDAVWYRRALLCLSQSFGLAACAYLRRLLENQIDPLLTLQADMQAAEGGGEEEATALRAARDGKVFADKIRQLYQYLPAAVRPAGKNVTRLLHDHLSVGVHALTEEECTEVARAHLAAVEYVAGTLASFRARHTRFADGAKTLGAPRRSGDKR